MTCKFSSSRLETIAAVAMILLSTRSLQSSEEQRTLLINSGDRQKAEKRGATCWSAAAKAACARVSVHLSRADHCQHEQKQNKSAADSHGNTCTCECSTPSTIYKFKLTLMTLSSYAGCIILQKHLQEWAGCAQGTEWSNMWIYSLQLASFSNAPLLTLISQFWTSSCHIASCKATIWKLQVLTLLRCKGKVHTRPMLQVLIFLSRYWHAPPLTAFAPVLRLQVIRVQIRWPPVQIHTGEASGNQSADQVTACANSHRRGFRWSECRSGDRLCKFTHERLQEIRVQIRGPPVKNHTQEASGDQSADQVTACAESQMVMLLLH